MTEEATEAETAQIHQSKKNLMLLLKKQLYVTEEAREAETVVKEAVFAESETALEKPVKE